MKNKIGLIILVVFSFLFIFSYYQKNSSLYEAIKYDKLENFKVAGVSYELKDQKIYKEGEEYNLNKNPIETRRVLGLLNFYVSVKEDPLFIGDDLDRGKVSSGVRDLEELQDNILDLVEKEESFLPIEYLKQIPELYDARINFLKSPTDIFAEDLIKKYKEVNSSYKSSAESLSEAIINYLPEGFTEESKIIFISSETSTKIIQDDLGKIIKNSGAISDEIFNREKILKGIREYSDNTTKESYDYELLGEYKILSKDDLNIPKATGDIMGPYYAYNSCFSIESELQPFYVYESISYYNKVPTIVKRANQNYFKLLRDDDEWRKAGYLYHPILDNSTYRCPDQENISDLITLDGYLKKYPNGLGGKIGDEEVVRLEDRIYNNEMVTAYDLLSLSGVFRETYAEVKKSNANLAEQILERILFIENRTGTLEMMADTNLYIDFFTEAMDPNNHQTNERNAFYFYSVRSAYSLTYMVYSDLVWKTDDTLSYVYADNNKEPEYYGYDLYTDLVNDYSEMEIEKWKELIELDPAGT